ncbi:SUKH-3 domain-containing protein [Kitasatospora sp. NPDC001261]|uniref:SUKH-3 domain-containing protein n=1 Tax=Kitasatospora sp. NPDC001261 TaxID=3364012 RepID=UPI0036B98AA5
MTSRFPAPVLRALTAAGRYEGVRLPERELRARLRSWGDPAAYVPAPVMAVLREFGGMTVHQYGPGADMSRMPFRIDPGAGLHADRSLRAHGARYGPDLVPVGEYDLGRGRLAMDAEGAVHLFWGDLWKVADSFDGALVALVEGRRPRRLDPAAPAPLPPGEPADEARARDLARHRAVRGGPLGAVDVVLREFELGWLAFPVFADPDPLANVGAGCLVVDRRNGLVTQMPALPADRVLDMYRAWYPAR